MEEVVWLHEYRTFAFLVSRGAYISFVTVDGKEVFEVENDDYDFWEERAIDYDTDDGS